jgi:hypothetical protein
VCGAANPTLTTAGRGACTGPAVPGPVRAAWVSDPDIRAMCDAYAPGPKVRAIGAEPDSRIGWGHCRSARFRPLG